MLFNSMAFMLFFPLVFSIYWLMPHHTRWFLLLCASYYFYMSWKPACIVLILFTTFISYAAARLIEREPLRKKQRWILITALVLCIGILFFYKYFNFFSITLSTLASRFLIPVHPVTVKLLLPVGISFYTFQTLSYVIDVYRGTVKAERHFGIYAAFISFFPQLVAGPIERTGNLLPQIKARHTFDANRGICGAKMMLWGYFKKMVIADLLAGIVDAVFANLCGYSGFALVLAVFFFSLQIYCDFSGYSDIAIGTARLLDIDLMINFKSPYFSSSIKEFWSRWHISLSTWFRDYVYIPMGGNRCSKLRQSVNLLTTFLVSGLWHGASWTFVLWGGVHGAAQIAERFLSRPIALLHQKKAGRAACTVFVFLFCCFAWVFFRAASFSDACYILTHSIQGIRQPLLYLSQGLAQLNLTALKLIYLFGLITILVVYDYLNKDRDIITEVIGKHAWLEWIVYLILGLLVVFFSQKGIAAEFVYFQF